MRNVLKAGTVLATLFMAALPGIAPAQDAKAPAAPIAVPAGAAPAAPKARSRHARPKVAAPSCDKVSDPWGDLCQIRKNADTACSDIATPAAPKARAARKTRKPAMPVTPERNQRQECVDAYMRNV